MKSPLPVGLPFIVSALVPLFRPASHAAEAPPAPVIPGFARFHAAGKPDDVEGGRLLLGELNCVSCHKPEPNQEAHLPRKNAPILDGVGGRVRRSYLRKFLTDPAGTKPGTTMPHVLAGMPESERREAVEALVHFLASTGSLRSEPLDKKQIATGRDLYHKVGCVACHGSRDAGGNPDKVLATSVPLGDPKTKHSLASLRAFLENPHQVRPSGRMPGLLNAAEAQQVANYLLQGLTPDAVPPNLTFAYYEGSWDRLPDFTKLKPLLTGQAAGFDVTLGRRGHDFAMRFEGYLRLNAAGEYRFHLTSDDGSKLWIDDELVVENDGIHAPSTTSGTRWLSKGVHKLVAAVFNAGGGVELRVDIEGRGLNRQVIDPHVFLTPEGEVKKPAPPDGMKDDELFPIRPELVAKGRDLFATAGCANCHALSIDKKPIESRLTAPQLAKLRPEGGCLDAEPRRGLPRYPLSTNQRSALVAALKAPPVKQPPAAREQIAQTLMAFNCYACHERDKVGGPVSDLDAFFATTQPEMGDEGRLPPPLNGVGAKLTSAYLRKVLDQGARDRPYMHTRMPRFGDANVGHLVAAFENVDTLESVAPIPLSQTTNRVKADARSLVGGNNLGCIKCHTFAGHKAEGVQAMELTTLTQRLKRDWFHRYMLNPAAFRPGTRMPAAWPNGKTFYTDVLDGDTAKQIEAIWVYLGDGSKAAIPPGVRKQAIPLVPDKEAIIYRNFVEGSGTRAIAVGYSEKAHLAFDANDLRLALLWHGDFIDASRHWTNRGDGFEPPLGDNVLRLPAGVSFAVLGKEDDPWPTKKGRELGERGEPGYKFAGYRLAPDQRPTFLYSVGDVHVEDTPTAVTSKLGPTMRRTLLLRAERPVDNLWFRAMAADKIESLGDGWYKINGEWKLLIQSSVTPRIRQSGGKSELLVPVRFRDGQAAIGQEFIW